MGGGKFQSLTKEQEEHMRGELLSPWACIKYYWNDLDTWDKAVLTFILVGIIVFAVWLAPKIVTELWLV